MQSVNYSYARNHLKSLIDEICEKDEEVIITTKNDHKVVMISLETYNKTHREIRRRIRQSLEEIERNDLLGIEEAFREVKETLHG